MSDEGGRFFHSQIKYMACKLKKDENIILELKYGRDHDTVVRNSFSKKNKLRLSRNSKFINSLLNI